MTQQNIDTKVELSNEEQQQITAVVEKIESHSPSDANVFFKLERVDDQLVGTVSIRSMALKVDVESTEMDVESIMQVLNSECKSQIKEWKKTRFL